MKQQEKKMEVSKSIVNGTMSNFKKMSKINKRTECLLIFGQKYVFLGSIEKQSKKLTITRKQFPHKSFVLFRIDEMFAKRQKIMNMNEVLRTKTK